LTIYQNTRDSAFYSSADCAYADVGTVGEDSVILTSAENGHSGLHLGTDSLDLYLTPSHFHTLSGFHVIVVASDILKIKTTGTTFYLGDTVTVTGSDSLLVAVSKVKTAKIKHKEDNLKLKTQISDTRLRLITSESIKLKIGSTSRVILKRQDIIGLSDLEESEQRYRIFDSLQLKTTAESTLYPRTIDALKVLFSEYSTVLIPVSDSMVIGSIIEETEQEQTLVADEQLLIKINEFSGLVKQSSDVLKPMLSEEGRKVKVSSDILYVCFEKISGEILRVYSPSHIISQRITSAFYTRGEI